MERKNLIKKYNSLISTDENFLSSLIFVDRGLLYANLLYEYDFELIEGFERDQNHFDYILINIESEKEKLIDLIKREERFSYQEKNKNIKIILN